MRVRTIVPMRERDRRGQGAHQSAHQSAYAQGHRAEHYAAWYLRLKGYGILARRWRSPSGEIDLVVRRGRCLAFVEVKYRPTLSDAAFALTPAQQTRIARTARDYMAAHPASAALQPRFDLVMLAPGHWPRHWRNAWLCDRF